MYVHIGSDVLIRMAEMIAIIDLKNLEDQENSNNELVNRVMKEGEVIDISDLTSENAKTLVLVDNDIIYVSPISTQTLCKRQQKFGLLEGLKLNGR